MAYLSLVWNCECAHDCEEAEILLRRLRGESVRWRSIVRQPGLAVFVDSRGLPGIRTVYTLHGSMGVVLGTLFFQSSRSDLPVSPQASLDERSSRTIISTNGQTLFDSYWGAYVAFLHDEGGRRSIVLRDPTGAIPGYYTTSSGVTLFFMRLQDCEWLIPATRRVNRRYLSGRLVYRAVCRRETGIEGISMVLAGERIEQRASRLRHSFGWSPVEIARTGVIDDFAQAVRLTKHAVRNCIRAWASREEGILLFLSGGLDSAIVLACLTGPGPCCRVVCLNHHSAGPASDERDFARHCTALAGVELLEWKRRNKLSLQDLQHLPRAPAPFHWSCDRESAAAEARLAEERGLSAVITGDGGDELVHRTGRYPTVIDYIDRHGLGPRLLDVAVADAQVGGQSIWQLLRAALRYRLAIQRHANSELYRSRNSALFARGIQEEAREDPGLRHPLFHDNPPLAPGKAFQAFHVASNAARGFNPCMPPGYPATVCPLISQPVVELSLRIPLHHQTSGGRDRAAARQAFRDHIPREVALRRTKGGVDGHVGRILMENLDFVRGFLLDGYLVNHGYLDAERLRTALSGEPTRVSLHNAELLEFLDLEAWARSWS